MAPLVNRTNDPLQSREVATWVRVHGKFINPNGNIEVPNILDGMVWKKREDVTYRKPVKFVMTAPRSYWRATPDEIAEVCNGMGPAGAGWAVPECIYSLCMTLPSEPHDWMYKYWKSQKEADKLFVANMHSAIKACGGWMRWNRHARAWAYYAAVRIGGMLFKG